MNTDDVQYLDWQWVEEHPESALDLMLKLHSDNAALKAADRAAIEARAAAAKIKAEIDNLF